MGKSRSNRNKVSKTKFNSFKSKFLNSNKNKRSYSVKDIEKIFPASGVVTHNRSQDEWYAWNDPNMTQEQYMEQYDISYEKNAQTKLWFGEEWARKSIPWDYHNQSHLATDIDLVPSSTTIATVPITDSLDVLKDTVASLTTSDEVTEEKIADLKSRVSVLEAKLDLMDKALQDIIDN